MRLRSRATLATTTTTNAGTETTASSRLVTGMDALVFATSLATGTLRTTATWEWTPTTAGWATTAWTRVLVDALVDLAAWTTAATTTAATPGPALALAPLALTLTPRSATLLKSIATLV